MPFCVRIESPQNKTTQREVFPMNKSILHFNEIGIKKIEKGLKNFMEHPDDLDSFADTVCQSCCRLAWIF